ncbi:hypothetical protein D3C72_1781750 [compost metagenome]
MPIRDEGLGVALSNSICGLPGPSATFFHLVFAFVGIRSQMTDVGDINDVTDFVAVANEYPAQNVFKHIRS